MRPFSIDKELNKEPHKEQSEELNEWILVLVMVADKMQFSRHFDYSKQNEHIWHYFLPKRQNLA